jgi:hypothetical protein
MDQIDVKDAWCNLMGNGVNSYTKKCCKLKGSTLYVELSPSVLRRVAGKPKL